MHAVERSSIAVRWSRRLRLENVTFWFGLSVIALKYAFFQPEAAAKNFRTHPFQR